MKKNLSTDRRYRMNVMFHKWKADPGLTMDAIEAFGFSGVVTNVLQKDGFVRSESNRQTFAALTAELRARGLEYWIYDENGYPSGQAGGITLEGNEALAAKGLYMRKFEAFLQPLSFTYTIDGGSDEIFTPPVISRICPTRARRRYCTIPPNPCLLPESACASN